MGQLFLKEPSALNEALRSFTTLESPIYVNKSIGSSGQLEIMPCECRQQAYMSKRRTRRRGGHRNDTSDENEDKSDVEEEGDEALCGPDSNCINRLTFMECFGDHCGCPSIDETNNASSESERQRPKQKRCVQRCANRRFQNREYSKIDVFHAGKKGFGVRALEFIPMGAFIYEYTGEVLDESRFIRRQQKYEREGVKHFYFMMLQKEEYIDATERGSIARFCNHSCNPNAAIEKWVVGPKLRMGLFAKRGIQAGEEICFDYKVDRYGSKAQPCYCNEPNCSGFLGGRTQTGGGPLPPSVIEGLGLDAETLFAWPERALQRLISRNIDLERVLNEQRALQRVLKHQTQYMNSNKKRAEKVEEQAEGEEEVKQALEVVNQVHPEVEAQSKEEVQLPNETVPTIKAKELEEEAKQCLMDAVKQEIPSLKEETRPYQHLSLQENGDKNLTNKQTPQQLKVELELKPEAAPASQTAPQADQQPETPTLKVITQPTKSVNEEDPQRVHHYSHPLPQRLEKEEDLEQLPTHIPLPVKPLTESELLLRQQQKQKESPLMKPNLEPELQELIPLPPPAPSEVYNGSLNGNLAPLELRLLPPVVQPPNSEPVPVTSNSSKRAASKRKQSLSNDLIAILDCEPLTEDAEIAKEELIASFPLSALTLEELPEFMRILMQLQETPWVIQLMLMRALGTGEPAVQSGVLNMHGYQIMGTVLNRWIENKDVVSVGLRVLQKWPKVTKNKISSSKIEPVVLDIKKSGLSSEITSLANDILEEWSGLSMGYRIPRRKILPHAQSQASSRESTAHEEVAQPANYTANLAELSLDPVGSNQNLTEQHNSITANDTYTPYRAIDSRKQRVLDTENTARIRKIEEEEEKQRQLAAARERQQQQAEIQRIIEEAAGPKNETPASMTPTLTPDMSFPNKRNLPPVNPYTGTSDDFTKKSSPIELTLAAYIPKLVFVHEENLGRDRCKRHARDIVQVLYKKELSRSTKEHEFELTKDRKNKIKSFVKEYMHKVISRHRRADSGVFPSPKRPHHTTTNT